MAERKQRKLQRFVTFHGDDNSETYGPDDELPAEYAKLLDQSAKDAGLEQHPAFADES